MSVEISLVEIQAREETSHTRTIPYGDDVLCGKERVQFLLGLSRVGVRASNMTADDADDELAFANRG